MLSDFIQVLNSAREFYTKNYYFPRHILFTIISLLQKQRLNPINYSKQELIMKLFVWATDNGMHMHAKNSEHYKGQIFVNKYSYIWVLIILYKNLLHKSEFGQVHCEEWFKRSPTKFILQFLDTPTNFYEFWNFETISEFKTIENELKFAA
jgi:hypothetical protein